MWGYRRKQAGGSKNEILYFIFGTDRSYDFVIIMPVKEAVGISILTYLLVNLYMTGKGYYLDGHAPDILVFGSMGILGLTVLIQAV
ncbi:hypothetical protein AS888_04440 [Peribacillus simplex]|uniref:Uncharacterized protein n=1 Tax=Peribacillus simplex TaxID=1478 RepID=A0A109N1G9_9BACI|nr:hypothetical protein [Peribacillus simplex]KWW21757.1 hypothetical protein AS888_04440 [Peribacillus simplex]